LDERFLREILCFSGVLCHSQTQGIDAPVVTFVKFFKSACIAVISSRMERYRTANFVWPRLETEAVSALTARESRRRPSLNEADKPSSSDSGKGSRER